VRARRILDTTVHHINPEARRPSVNWRGAKLSGITAIAICPFGQAILPKGRALHRLLRSCYRPMLS
jgi:hypothetical protein